MIKLPDFSVNRPVTIFMIFSAIALFGIISLSNLAIELMPSTNLGTISITTYVRGGMPSVEIEKRLAKLLEENLSDISHLKDILTISKEGESTVVLQFDPETNMDYASLEVRERLAKIKDLFPREAERPIISQYGYGDFPITAVTLISEKFTPEELRKFAEDALKERFLRINGVARIETVGGREEKVIIELDKYKLAAYNLSLNEVLDMITVSNINLVGGEVPREGKEYLVRCMGEFKNIEDIKNLGIKISDEGSILRLKDIGEIKADFLDPHTLSRLNIRPAVTLYVFKKSLANTLKVCDEVKATAAKIQKEELGKDINLIVSFNQAEFVKNAIRQLRKSLLIGSILAVTVLILFLRDYLTIMVLSLSMPFSLLFVFSLMYAANMSLNVMTLAGLCLGSGMLIDASILVLENVFLKRRQNKITKDAIAGAANEVSLAIFASIITTIIVFLPLIFVNKETQKLYSGIALSITFSLIGSLFISLSLIPCLSNFFLKKRVQTKTLFFEKVEQAYQKSLEFVLQFRYPLIIITIITTAGVILLSQKLEKDFIGVPEQDKFTIFVELPTGTRLDVTDKIVNKAEEIVERFHEENVIKHYTTRVEPYSAKIYVELVPAEKRKPGVSEVISELRKETEKLAPAFIYYEEPQEVESKEIIIEFFGYDYDILKNLAMESAKLLNGIQGLTDVKIRMRQGAPELKVLIDKNKAALFGLDTYSVSLTLHGHLRGLIPTRYRPTEESFVSVKKTSQTRELPLQFYAQYAKEIEIIARLQEKYRKKFKDLENISFITPQGRVKLNQMAQFETGLAPSEIWRKNKKRMVQVSANKGILPLSRVAREIEDQLKTLKLEEGYTWKFGQGYEKMLRNQKELRFAFIIALVLVYLVLASLFESFFQPIIILTSIALAGIGSIPLLYLKREPMGIGVLLGGIMLTGIVVNNAIILIHAINRTRRKFSLFTSVIRASGESLRPITMTATTTTLPLLPLIFSKTEASPLWAPLALTVVPGIIVSTILTIYVIPCFYLIMSKDKQTARD